MQPKYYVKKIKQRPILAMQFKYSESCIDELKEFMGAYFGLVQKSRHPGAVGHLQINCLIDNVLQPGPIASEGDYIIKVKNGFKPVKEHLFHETYEKETS